MSHWSRIRLAALATLIVPALEPGPGRIRAADQRPASRPSEAIEIDDCLIKAVKTARLATDRPGVLTVMDLKEGDVVRDGQLLARLMDEVAQVNFGVAKLTAESTVEIEYAEKLNAVDRVEVDKALDVNQKHANTVTDIELRRLQLNQEKSRLQIEKARKEKEINELKAKQAEAELKTYRVVAPFDGVVTRVLKYRGEAVKQGDPVLEVVNTDVVQVEGQVNEKDIWNVHKGDEVVVRLSLRDAEVEAEKKSFRGRIGFVDVVANSASRETRVWAEVANPDNVLRPGLKGHMTIVPRSAPAAGLKGSRLERTAPAGRLAAIGRRAP